MIADLKFALRMLAKKSGLYYDRGAYARARHWRKHRDLQRRQCRAAATASIFETGAVIPTY